MISGATRGSGGSALGAHLADAKQLNERTELGLSRGLVSDTIRSQIVELTDLSSHSRAARPLYHLHADPPPGAAWTESTWQRYWFLTEQEFDLERAAFSEERHVKSGREHRHRVYSLVRDDGTTNAMSHDFQRREKLSRIMEFETEATLTPGAHNRSVITALERAGRDDVAGAMRAIGLHTMERPRAPTTPVQRSQAERAGVDLRAVGATILAAWTAADTGHAFAAALRERGFLLARGTKAALVVDSAGGSHNLAKMLGLESKASGAVRIAAAVVRERLVELNLPPLDQVRSELAAAQRTNQTGILSDTAAPPTALADWILLPNQTATAQAAKLKIDAVAAEAAPKPIGGRHNPKPNHPSLADTITNASQVVRERRVERDVAAAGAAALDGRGPPPAQCDGDQGPGRDAADDGQERAGTDPVRRPSVGDHDGQPPVASGAVAGEGDEPDRLDHRVTGASRGEPDQDGAQAGRTRIAARRTAVGIAAAVQARGGRLEELTRALASPPTVVSIQMDRVQTAMAQSRARVAAIMITAPFPDPVDRSRAHLQGAARNRVKATMEARVAAATAAVDRAEQLRYRVGWVFRALAAIGLETPAVRQAAEAARGARKAEWAAKDARLDYRDDLVHADRSGAAEADRRQRQQDSWEKRPDVRMARREEDGNRMVAAALMGDKTGIKDFPAQEEGLRITRKMLLQKEAKRLAPEQCQERPHNQPPAVSAPVPRADPAPAGFRR